MIAATFATAVKLRCRPVAATGAALLWLAFTAPGGAAPAASPAAIVEAEHRFAASVAAHGVGPGFLEFLADTAVVLAPRPTPARALYEALPADGARLVWQPDLAAISAAGDFGWSSGPWLHFARDGEAADGSGHYFTVWRRTPEGLKVVFDGGVDHPADPAQRNALAAATPRLRPARGGGVSGEPACEQAYFVDWQHKGRAAALARHAARDVRLLGPGIAPLDGRDALGADPLAGSPLVAARVTRRLSSERGEIYFLYGEYELGIQGVYGRRHFAFAAVFDAGDGCRLALELVSPVPPATP